MVRLASGRKLSTSSQPYRWPSPSWSSSLPAGPPTHPLDRRDDPIPRPPPLARLVLPSFLRSGSVQHVETFGTRRTEERYASFGYPTGRLARLRSACLRMHPRSDWPRAIGMRKGPPVKIFSITARACRPDSDPRVCVPICPRVSAACPYALVCFVTGERYVAYGNRNSGRVMGVLIRNTVSAHSYRMSHTSAFTTLSGAFLACV